MGPIWQAVMLHMMCHMYGMSMQLLIVIIYYFQFTKCKMCGVETNSNLLIMSTTTIKSTSTTTESHKKLDSAVETLSSGSS